MFGVMRPYTATVLNVNRDDYGVRYKASKEYLQQAQYIGQKGRRPSPTALRIYHPRVQFAFLTMLWTMAGGHWMTVMLVTG